MARRRTIAHDPLETVNAGAAKRVAPEPSAPVQPPASKAPAVIPSTAIVPVSPVVDLSPSETELQAMAVIRRHLGWSTAAGLLPLPWIDFAAMVAVNMRMLSEIARIYRQPFPPKVVVPLVGSLLGGVGAFTMAGPAFLLLRSIPLVGPIAGWLTLPAMSAAACYATGKVFIQHFESGGTFLDFQPAKVRAHYARHFAAARSGEAP